MVQEKTLRELAQKISKYNHQFKKKGNEIQYYFNLGIFIILVRSDLHRLNSSYYVNMKLGVFQKLEGSPVGQEEYEHLYVTDT